MAEWLLLVLAYVCGQLGVACFALALPAHWSEVNGRTSRGGTPPRLRLAGAVGLVASLLLCLAADHASMAVLVWVMSLSVSAVTVAVVLAYHPTWLRWLGATFDRPSPG